MFGKQHFPSTGESSGKPSFAQACNVLSQYLRERGSLKDLRLGIGGKPEPAATVDLLSTLEKPEQRPVQPFPQFTGTDPVLSDKREAKAGTRCATMTIFYGGKVLVFRDVWAEKAEEIMQLARRSTGSGRGIPASPDGLFEYASGLPIARRTSLHKFLDKRKERAEARAPYQLHNPSMASVKQARDFDLNL